MNTGVELTAGRIGPASADAIVEMGRIAGAFGVRGWVKVHTFSEDPATLQQHPSWLIGDGSTWREAAVVETELHGLTVVAHLTGIDDRDAAAALRGQKVGLRRASLPEPEEGEFYWADLVGLRVVNAVGEDLGGVLEIFSNGAQEVLRVGDDAGERLIPFVDSYIERVEMTERRIVVDWQRDW